MLRPSRTGACSCRARAPFPPTRAHSPPFFAYTPFVCARSPPPPPSHPLCPGSFWSTEVQPGSAFPKATEPFSSMEAAVAVYSTAPVMLSDGAGFTNATLALATCTSGGRLLQPSRPATALDACFAAAARGDGSAPAAQKPNALPVMSTHTAVGGRAWAHVLVIGLAGDAALTPSMLPLDVAPAAGDAGLLAYEGWREAGGGAFTLLGAWSEGAPLTLRAAPDPHAWSLTHAAPLLPSGWAYLGEAAKLAPVSAWRTASVEAAPGGGGGGVAVGVRGEPGEAVALSVAQPQAGGGWRVVAHTCVLPAAGAATVVYDGAGGRCE